MKIIFLGPPGAGKGTQSGILSKKFGIPVVSTGHILREAARQGTEIGTKAKEYMDAGQLVPDDIIIDIVAKRLAAPDCQNGYILDGVPRTLVQAEVMEKAGVMPDAVIAFRVTDEEIERRMNGRRICSKCEAIFHIQDKPPQRDGVCDVCSGELIQRSDDSLETLRQRMKIYYEQTKPLRKFYEERGALRLVESRPPVSVTTKLVLEALGVD